MSSREKAAVVVAAAQLKRKLNRLRVLLLSYKKVLVAYSGGVDSSFLLKACTFYLGKDVLAVTAVSPTYTRRELKNAQETAKGLGARHRIIQTCELDNPEFTANPKNRCYYCKSELFSKLREIARLEGISFILDGSNLDDGRDYRPGAQAKKELGIQSPLAKARLTKEDIRRLSRGFGLKTWDAPSAACLASRFAYGQKITKGDLRRIEKAERFIRSKGFRMARVRHYQLSDKTRLARIEVDKKDISGLSAISYQLSAYLKRLGYDYVTLDLEGYRAGSMNVSLLRR